MEINSLTISNFRGIKGEFRIEPEGENVVLVGPNGSGKSSVIAAMDYLFTNSVQELSGRGTGGISETEHAPHVDAEPSEAWVEATLSIDGDELTIRRCLADGDLKIKSSSETETSSEPGSGPKRLPEPAEVMLDVADRGLHLLSRDEILDFITSTGSTRSERIRELLDLQNIKDRRLALKSTENHFENTAEQLSREVESQTEHLLELLEVEEDYISEEDKEAETAILLEVNRLRKSLGAEEVETLDEDFRGGIDTPSEQVSVPPILEADGHAYIDRLDSWMETGVKEFLDKERRFREMWESIDKDEEALEALERRQLINSGLRSLETSEDRCPLCHQPWDSDELEQYLETRMEKAELLEEKVEEIEPLRDDLQENLTDVRMAASSLLELIEESEFNGDPLRGLIATVSDWEDGLDGDLLENPPKYEASELERKEMLTPEGVDELLNCLREDIQGRDIEDIREKWEDLAMAEERYRELEKTRQQASKYSEVAKDTREPKRSS